MREGTAGPQEFREELASSRDGTEIRCQVRGRGPGLVLLPGANSSAGHYRELASALAADFTVYTMIRRGRTGSGPQGPEYSLAKEAEDVSAVLAKTGSRFLFGHSSGAALALETALAAGPALDKLALYEPPYQLRDDWLPAFENLLKTGDYVAAQVAALEGLGVSPLLKKADQSRLTQVFAAYYRGVRYKDLPELLLPLPAEIRAVKKATDQPGRYAAVGTETLLLWGEATEERLRRGAGVYGGIIGRCRTLCLPALDHSGPQVRPAAVAGCLLDFFLAPAKTGLRHEHEGADPGV